MNEKVKGFIKHDSLMGYVTCVPTGVTFPEFEVKKYPLCFLSDISVSPFTSDCVEGYISEKGHFVAERNIPDFVSQMFK